MLHPHRLKVHFTFAALGGLSHNVHGKSAFYLIIERPGAWQAPGRFS
jgi:hypothetical protein